MFDSAAVDSSPTLPIKASGLSVLAVDVVVDPASSAKL